MKLKGTDTGWRAGVAYEIPEIALRTQLMYRSGTTVDADGTIVTPFSGGAWTVMRMARVNCPRAWN